MEFIEYEKLLKEPDAILLKSEVCKELNEFICQFTVPIAIFQGEPCRENIVESGSGVLFNINSSLFILTAGHCVKALNENKDVQGKDQCAIGIANDWNQFLPQLGRRCYRYNIDEGVDYGFIEIPPNLISSFSSYSKFGMGTKRICVYESDDLIRADDWMVVSGYPDQIMIKEDTAYGVRLLVCPTIIAGTEDAPTASGSRPVDGMRTIDIWTPKRGNICVYPEIDLKPGNPSKGGMSGGGLWKANVRPNPDEYDVKNLQLVGIHVGTFKEDDDDKIFSREVLIGHCLKLVAETCDDIKRQIYDIWPELKNDNWLQ